MLCGHICQFTICHVDIFRCFSEKPVRRCMHAGWRVGCSGRSFVARNLRPTSSSPSRRGARTRPRGEKKTPQFVLLAFNTYYIMISRPAEPVFLPAGKRVTLPGGVFVVCKVAHCRGRGGEGSERSVPSGQSGRAPTGSRESLPGRDRSRPRTVAREASRRRRAPRRPGAARASPAAPAVAASKHAPFRVRARLKEVSTPVNNV